MSSNTLVSYICCMLVLYTCVQTQAEVFTAISDVENLLTTHEKIINELDNYIQKEDFRLISLKKYLHAYKNEHDKAVEDISIYLENPLNAFTLIKRLTIDLNNIEKYVNIGTAYIENINLVQTDMIYPSLEDLTGAAVALTRLQDTYNLNITDLSEGILNGVSYSTPMVASDCYELSRSLYDVKDFKSAIEWMKEAWRKYKIENEIYFFNEVDILEYIASSYYSMGDIQNALEWTQKQLLVDPDNDKAQNRVSHYQNIMAKVEANFKSKQQEVTEEEKGTEKAVEQLTGYAKNRKTYESLCRGEIDVSPEISKKLKCWYMTENHPFLKLAPIKVEQMYISPDIFVFHEVLSDDEIEVIKEIAKPRFKRATVNDSKSGKQIPAEYRISKSAWLQDEESPVIARVSQRVSDMTGLSMDTAEYLQVVNYGIGGHYKPHYDFARKGDMEFTKNGGNRIATVLFYMSDVAQGGATVFPELGLSLFPVKGAAAFWLNLHPSGEGDLATKHAACPVLRGSKWVSNKWIRQDGQVLLKPCNLEYQDEEIIGEIPSPVFKNSSTL